MSNPWDAAEYDTTFGFVTKYGNDLLDLLAVEPGELVLDLGCGTGHHAAELAGQGADVVGLDADADMLARARVAHPEVEFVLADAAAFSLADLPVDRPFDACFSNAALHWMQPPDRVLANVHGVLRESGRFVAEMGGAGNIANLDASLRSALGECELIVEVPLNYFPTVGEQASALERAGFRVDSMRWFSRPTPLAEGTTAADWTRHFRAMVWQQVPRDRWEDVAIRVNLHAQERGLKPGTGWFADYCRVRFVATAM